jgi:4-carboxymuconolactone decarboxylase
MTLTMDETHLVRFFTACVVGNWGVARTEFAAGTIDLRWREALLQVHLFAGFPRLVQAFRVMDEAGSLPPATETEALPEERAAAGAALFDSIYDDLADPVRSELASFDPAFATWIAEHAYARVLARPGLSPRLRELLAIGALTALSQDRQLASHTRGAIRCGARTDEPAQVLDALADLVDATTLEVARGVVDRFTEA